MTTRLMEIFITNGRTTPGTKQKNEVTVRRYPQPEAATPKAKVKKNNA